MYQTFTWRGEPIQDIKGWADDRGERIVKYQATRPTPWGHETYDGYMPESFWNSLCMNNGWTYKEIV